MAAPRAARALEAWSTRYRHTWRASLVSSFLSPVLFLTAIGLGLGSQIDDDTLASLGGVPYIEFLAPGLLAATALQVGAGEAMYPVMSAIRWTGTYKAMLATPLTVRDVVIGHLAWMTLRLLMVTSAFVVVIVLFGAAASPAIVAAVPAAVLCGLSMAAPIMALSASLDHDGAYAALQRFVLVPMFLFSGTFFPISQLPAALRPVAWLTPLWHGVELCRGITLGTLGGLEAVGHIAFLALLVGLGATAALTTYRRRLAA